MNTIHILNGLAKQQNEGVCLSTLLKDSFLRFMINWGICTSITCSRHQSLQKFEFELTKSFVIIFLLDQK